MTKSAAGAVWRQEEEMTRHVEITRDGAVLEIRLNKPKVNAIGRAMSRELVPSIIFSMIK